MLAPLEAVKANALRLNNNMLGSWEGFLEILDLMIIEPYNNLQWLDFSFNDLKTIDEVGKYNNTNNNTFSIHLEGYSLSGGSTYKCDNN